MPTGPPPDPPPHAPARPARHRTAREGEEQRRRQQRQHSGGEHAHDPPLGEAACEVKGEHHPKRGKQPERVPVCDWVAQPLIGYLRRCVPEVGQHASDEPRHAHDRRAEHEPPDEPADVGGTPAHGSEQHEHQQVHPYAIELDHRSARRVRPRRRDERQRRVRGERRDCHERDRRHALKRVSRLRDPHKQDLRQYERHDRGGSGEVSARVET
jgi:hypothetical protein